MAYLVLDKQYGFTFISKDLEEFKCQHPGAEGYIAGILGYAVEISNEDFIALQTGQKDFVSYDGTTVTYRDATRFFATKEKLDSEINLIKSLIDEIIKRKGDSSSQATRLSTYKAVLESLDTSTINYPLNSSLEKYLLDNGHEVISPLQII